MSKYLNFVKYEVPNRKTPIYRVLSNSNNTILGTIEWYAQWRRYTFRPTPGVSLVFDVFCLHDIVEFIEQLMRARLMKESI